MTPWPAPRRIDPVEIVDAAGGCRLSRILGRPISSARTVALADLDTTSGDPFTAMWIDATAATPVYRSNGTTAAHILWTSAKRGHTVEAGSDPEERTGLRVFDITPGDTITIPTGAPFRIGEGTLAFVFGTAALDLDPACGPSPGAMPLPPVHGLSRFHRFNRQTICSATPELVLERWKLTHPIEMRLAPDRWHYLANLTEPVALAWPGGTDLLDRIRSCLLPPGLETISLVPGGLGYILLGYLPDLERDVVAPLRQAGFDPDSIASLGVPNEYLR